MIDPQKNCIWASRKITELAYKDNEFIGKGISLRVLLHAFEDTNFIWYSKTYGNFDDNIIAIATDRCSKFLLNKLSEQNEEMLPLKEAIGRDFCLEEYILTDEIQSCLGIKDEKVCRLGQSDVVKHQINIHDNCFSSIEPVNKELLRKLILCVLRQHSFYLNIDVDWSNVILHIINRLIEFSTIQIKSCSKRKLIQLKLSADKRSFIEKMLNPSLSDIIVLNDGCAFTSKVS